MELYENKNKKNESKWERKANTRKWYYLFSHNKKKSIITITIKNETKKMILKKEKK